MQLATAVDDGAVVSLRAGSFRVRIDLPASVADQVRSTFRDMVETGSTKSDHFFVVAEAGEGYAVTVDGVLWAPGVIESLCDQLMYALLRASLDSEPNLLHLHGGYVGVDGRGVLIAGFPRSGKSTLVTRLVEAGFDYGTDERVSVDRRLRLTPFVKPISLVEGSFHLLSNLDPTHTGAGCASSRLWQVPASVVRPDCVRAPTELGAIVFLERRDGATPTTSPLHPAELARLLLSDSPDAGRFGADAVDVAARLCASVPCVKLVYGDAPDAVEPIRRLAGAPHASSAADVRSLEPRSGVRHRRRLAHGQRVEKADVLGVMPGVSGVVACGRALLHQASTGKIIELNEVLTIWLQLLDGRATVGQIAHEVAEENNMATTAVMDVAVATLSQLIERGLVR